MRKLFVLAVLGGCYAPHAQPGSPCSDGQPCASGLVCSPATHSCELVAVGIDAAIVDGHGVDAISSDAPPAPVNDLPGGAIDVTAGGTFTADLTYANDDAKAPTGTTTCGSNGGLDVYYKVSVGADEVYYFDTFGSDFDTVIRVYTGSCQTGIAPGGTACRNDACGGLQSQYSGSLTPGDHCLEIDQKAGSTTGTNLVLHVERGNRDGTRLALGSSTVSGDTCTGTADATSTCGGDAKDLGYYMTGCPGVTGALSATTCSASLSYDSSLAVLGPGNTEIACNNDDATCATPSTLASTLTNVSLAGPHLFWLIVDGPGATQCGAYSLTATLN